MYESSRWVVTSVGYMLLSVSVSTSICLCVYLSVCLPVTIPYLCQVVMDFTAPDGGVRRVYLPRRSVLIMAGASRYSWTHGIVPRKTDVRETVDGLTLSYRATRVSYTFRRLRRRPCDCSKLSLSPFYRPTVAVATAATAVAVCVCTVMGFPSDEVYYYCYYYYYYYCYYYYYYCYCYYYYYYCYYYYDYYYYYYYYYDYYYYGMLMVLCYFV